MKNIPNITFQSNEHKRNFELLNLTSLFERLDSIEDHEPRQPHRIAFFALLVVTKGTGTHQIDLKDYEVKEGTVLKIAKGQVHSFQRNATYQGFLILFTEEFLMNYFSKSSINLISNLYNYHLSSPFSMNKIDNEILIHQLQSEIALEINFAHHNIVAAFLDLYLLKLERKSPDNYIPKNKSKLFRTFDQFKSLVETNFTKTRNVKDYANLLYISTKTLNASVKEFTLNTAKNFIDDYVILEIKREMMSTNKSLKEIAFDIGFDEVTNFTKFFKKKMNLSPKEFKSNQLY
ncbi:transcriptional regulator, AraC family [Polaribacter sp. KT25b]|uniref:helix-turn-helix domain-containing protein n=1 Tax=Polaribacter sp. KT25b TaxID=1855336 RepID=UPI00087CF8ED|nr:helix-turn-helix domain-containing protein [Polaribacter sp. KT25b]SDS31891.1 transcriptional regulator, AraC family [Polaribacter sp. KT25b]